MKLKFCRILAAGGLGEPYSAALPKGTLPFEFSQYSGVRAAVVLMKKQLYLRWEYSIGKTSSLTRTGLDAKAGLEQDVERRGALLLPADVVLETIKWCAALRLGVSAVERGPARRVVESCKQDFDKRLAAAAQRLPAVRPFVEAALASLERLLTPEFLARQMHRGRLRKLQSAGPSPRAPRQRQRGRQQQGQQQGQQQREEGEEGKEEEQAVQLEDLGMPLVVASRAAIQRSAVRAGLRGAEVGGRGLRLWLRPNAHVCLCVCLCVALAAAAGGRGAPPADLFGRQGVTRHWPMRAGRAGAPGGGGSAAAAGAAAGGDGGGTASAQRVRPGWRRWRMGVGSLASLPYAWPCRSACMLSGAAIRLPAAAVAVATTPAPRPTWRRARGRRRMRSSWWGCLPS